MRRRSLRLLLRRRLSLSLRPLLLLRMLLLEFFCLLLVPLFHLLLVGAVGLLMLHPLVFLILFLLELLPLLLLFGKEFVLLLLMFPVLLRFSGSRSLHWWKVFGMDRGMRTRVFATILGTSPIGGRVVRSSGLSGRNTTAKFVSTGSRGNRRLAMVGRGAQLWVGPGLLKVFSLRGDPWKMPLAGSDFVFGARPRLDTTRTAVVADPVHGCDIHSFLVNVPNVHNVHVDNRAIVEEPVAVPAPADEAETEIAKAIIDSAIETDMWPPIALMKDIDAAIPTPVRRSPQKSRLGR